MECRFKTAAMDYETGKYLVTFETASREAMERCAELAGEDLEVEVGKKRKKRSLDANAYAWVLMQKIAEATHSDKWTVYLEMLKRYSRAFTFVIVKPSALDRAVELFRTCVDLGEVKVNGAEGHQLQVYFGSSQFDTKEMSVLLDGIVSECRELGIETMTPNELERLKEGWGK